MTISLNARTYDARVNCVRLLPCVIAGLVLWSCSSAVGPSTTPTPSVGTPAATASTLGQLAASPSHSSAWTKQSVADPRLELDVPASWHPLPLDAFRQQLEDALPKMSSDGARVWKYQIDLIDAGQLRAVFAGPSPASTATASIEVIVLPGSESLTEAVSREQEIVAAMIGGQRLQTDVTLPIGSAIRVLVTTDPEGGIPSQGIQYFVKLGDTTTLMLIGTAPAADIAFGDVMAHVAQSLSRSE